MVTWVIFPTVHSIAKNTVMVISELGQKKAKAATKKLTCGSLCLPFLGLFNFFLELFSFLFAHFVILQNLHEVALEPPLGFLESQIH